MSVAVFIAVASYVGYFLVRYQWPRTPLPSVDATIGGSFASNEAAIKVAQDAEARLLAAIEVASMPAVSAAVGIGGRLVWAQALGFADVESRTPVSLSTAFRLGSTSKALTGTLLGRLLERGAIGLDAPIGRLVPELPAHLAGITPRQLASHTAGVRHYGLDLLSHPPIEALQNERYHSVGEALSIFRDDPLEFPPGSGFLYSTYGYVLLSRVLEAAGGADFPTLISREVFDPSGMRDSRAEHYGTEGPRDATSYYESRTGRYTHAFATDNSFRWAGGGFIGSPRDLVSLGNALLTGQLVSDETRAVLFEPQLLLDGTSNPQSYALGWRSQESTSLFGEQSPVRIVHHGGVQAGGACFFMLLPEHDFVVAVMANSGSRQVRGEVQDLAMDLTRLFLPPASRAGPGLELDPQVQLKD